MQFGVVDFARPVGPTGLAGPGSGTNRGASASLPPSPPPLLRRIQTVPEHALAGLWSLSKPGVCPRRGSRSAAARVSGAGGSPGILVCKWDHPAFSRLAHRVTLPVREPTHGPWHNESLSQAARWRCAKPGPPYCKFAVTGSSQAPPNSGLPLASTSDQTILWRWHNEHIDSSHMATESHCHAGGNVTRAAKRIGAHQVKTIHTSNSATVPQGHAFSS